MRRKQIIAWRAAARYWAYLWCGLGVVLFLTGDPLTGLMCAAVGYGVMRIMLWFVEGEE